MAYFPNGLNGWPTKAGGGICGTQSGALYKNVNAMVGNITAGDAGGTTGHCNNVIDSCVNSMTGDISGTSYAGGIVGRYYALSSGTFSITRAPIYMTGDIISGSGFVGFVYSVG